MNDFEEIFGNRFFHAEEGLGRLEGSERFNNIMFEMLDEDDGLPFEQEIESLLCPVDLKEAVDDENHEDDSGEDRKINGRETSTGSLSSVIPEQSATLPILPEANLS